MKITSMTVKTIVLIAIIICVTAFGDVTSVQKEQDIARSNAMRTRLQEEQLERTNRLKDSFEIKTNETIRLLKQISEINNSYTQEKEQLLTNSQGKQLVMDSKSFMAFLYLYDNPIVTADQIKSKLASSQSILQTIQNERKLVDVGYLPSPELFDELNSLYVWSKDQFTKLEAQRATLKTILSEASELKEQKNTKTLAKAIEEYRTRLPKLLAESKIIGEQLAEEESMQILVDAARLAKLEKAMAERDRMFEQMKIEITQLKLQQELELTELKAQAERERFEVERRLQDTLAELERLRKEDAARRTINDINADLALQEKLDDAKRKELLAKINTPEVKSLMSYFTANGYSQPGKRGVSRDYGPVSYSQLRTYGALTPDSNGLSKLMTAMNSSNSDRPKFTRTGRTLKGLSQEEHQRLVNIQNCLIELGPLMVEEGMLAP